MNDEPASGESDEPLGESELSDEELDAMQRYLRSHAPSEAVVLASRQRLEAALAKLVEDGSAERSSAALHQQRPTGEFVSLEPMRGRHRGWAPAMLWSGLSVAAAIGLFILARSPADSANTDARDVLTKGNGRDVPELLLWCGGQELDRHGASCPVGRAITAQLRARGEARKFYTAVVVCRERAECISLGVGLSSSSEPAQVPRINNTEAGSFDGFVFVADAPLREHASVVQARALLEHGMSGLATDVDVVPFYWKAE